jgi:hypothetical protein
VLEIIVLSEKLKQYMVVLSDSGFADSTIEPTRCCTYIDRRQSSTGCLDFEDMARCRNWRSHAQFTRRRCCRHDMIARNRVRRFKKNCVLHSPCDCSPCTSAGWLAGVLNYTVLQYSISSPVSTFYRAQQPLTAHFP